MARSYQQPSKEAHSAVFLLVVFVVVGAHSSDVFLTLGLVGIVAILAQLAGLGLIGSTIARRAHQK